jgi:hypothetical protein
MGSGLAQERAPERRVTRNEGWYDNVLLILLGFSKVVCFHKMAVGVLFVPTLDRIAVDFARLLNWQTGLL